MGLAVGPIHSWPSSGREIGLKVPASAGLNVPERVRNAQQSAQAPVRNVPSPAGQPIASAGMQARNSDALQARNNDRANSRRTGRHSDNKAVHGRSSAHGHSNRLGRANSTHVRD